MIERALKGRRAKKRAMAMGQSGGKTGDRPAFELVDMNASGAGAVAAAFANQVAYCAHAGAHITARVVAGIAAVLGSEAQGELLARIRDWPGAPLADALPLRVAGGLHALHLSGAAPELAPIYRGRNADDAGIVADVMAAHEPALLPWLGGPPQTNEAGRSANFIAAMLWLADRRLPARFQCLEIGSSAGINLMLDRYAYDLGGVKFGPADGVMHFAPAWQGTPPPARDIAIVSTKGCDVAPVDLMHPAQALRLKAYIWPEHTIRFERMDAAIRAASARKPDLVEATAADFVEAELAKPQVSGTTRMLMQSDRCRQICSPAGQQDAGKRRPMEGRRPALARGPMTADGMGDGRGLNRFRCHTATKLTVRYWPGGAAGVQTRLVSTPTARM